MDEAIRLETGYGYVFGDYKPLQAKSPALILAHGYRSDRHSRTISAICGIMNARGISTLSIDLYGHGQSQGDITKLTLTKALDGLEEAIRFCRAQGHGGISLSGSSFSGQLCLIAASRNDLNSIALKCPVFDMRELWAQRLGEEGLRRWADEGRLKEEEGGWDISAYKDACGYDMQDIAGNILAPTLIVHGESDTAVPISQSESLTRSLRTMNRLESIPGADHRFSESEGFDRMVHEICSWVGAFSAEPGERVLCCPRCMRPLAGKSFMARGFGGMLHSLLGSFICSCGHRGMPISIELEHIREER